MMPTRTATRPSYQEGSLQRIPRAKGPDVWVYRWRETNADGKRVHRKLVIGDVNRLPTTSDAKREVDNLRTEVNARQGNSGKITVGQAWGHFQLNELRDEDTERSETTIDRYLQVFKRNILPDWEHVLLEDVKTVQVKKWLKGLNLANGTKAKIRNTFCVLFNHCIRWELHDKNPISGPVKGSGVRQSGVRQRDPDILTVDEMRAILGGIGNQAIKVMVAVAATTGMRRSEVCGLKWSDLDFEKQWFALKRGVIHNTRVSNDETAQYKQKSRPVVTKLKTNASRKGVPMIEGLAEVLAQWRKQTPYPADSDWVFASPHQNGEWPYNPVPAMRYWVQPAAAKAGCMKHIGWHTFRHSVGSLLGQYGENVKVVQEILRHASPRLTQELYQQADQTQKREALKRFSGLFVVPDKKIA